MSAAVVSTYLSGGVSVIAFRDGDEERGTGLNFIHERTCITRYFTAAEARALGEALVAAAATREASMMAGAQS